MTDRLIDPAWQQTEQPDWHGYRDELDEDGCAICGNPVDDGEGWNGLCGNCADVQESRADDHDQRYDAMYSDRTEVADNDMVE